MYSVTERILTLLAAHPHPVTFFLLVLTGLGLPVPEDVILLAAGAVVSWGRTGYYPIVGAALLGVLVGDLLLFLLGRRYGPNVLKHRPFRYLASPRRMDRARDMLARRGAGAVFLARFVAGVRFAVFFVAGASGMNAATFVLLDLTGAVLSVPLVVLVGYVFGSNLEEALGFLHAHRWQVLAAAVGLVLAGWALVRVGRALGLWNRIRRAGAALAGGYLGRRRWFRLALLAAALGGVVYYAAVAAQPLPAADRNFREIARIPAVGPGEPFSFAVLGDNRNSQTVFTEILRRIDADPDIRFAVDLGDLVFDGEREKYRFFLEQIGGFTKPLLVAPGNHDIREGGRAVYYDAFGPFYYSFRVGDALFVVLDDADEVGFTPSQWAWAERVVKESGAAHTFVMFHVPLFDPRHRTDLDWLKAVLPGPARNWMFHHSLADDAKAREYAAAFRRWGVTRLYCSHVHGFYRGEWAGVPFTLTGGAGAPLVGVDPEHDFYHYVKVTVGPGGVREEVVRIPSPSFGLLARAGNLVFLHLRSFVATHVPGTVLFLVFAVGAWDLLAARRGRENAA
ncbi:VTT domain-containing protein [Deferrisoma camini]|uniref:VTT domain-containing protein n=1 Tax=Deferrisoma camini TaxID=1035120 RepID=UPI00046D9391|nr:VTT domain-containing protein [Deferrisoma camini]